MLGLRRLIIAALLLLPTVPALAQIGTTTALASSGKLSVAGQFITLTATVTGSSPTGTVTFKDRDATLVPSSGVAVQAGRSFLLAMVRICAIAAR